MKRIFIVLTTFLIMNMNAQQSLPPSSISVTGEGMVKITPDKAVVSVSVEHSGKEMTVVKKENDDAVNEVLKFCKSLKIEATHIQTARINLNKNYDYQLKIYRYVANQSLTIQLKNLEKYEALMQGLLASGINRIDNVAFESSESENLEAVARKKAMINAKAKATEYAAAVGQEIGRAIYITETGNATQPPLPMYRAAMALQATNGPQDKETIAMGELEILVKINVVFELK